MHKSAEVIKLSAGKLDSNSGNQTHAAATIKLKISLFLAEITIKKIVCIPKLCQSAFPPYSVCLHADKEQGSKVSVVYLTCYAAGAMISEGSRKSLMAQTSPPVFTLLLRFTQTY